MKMAKPGMMEIYDIEKIQSFKRLGVTVECITAYDNTLLICIRGGQLLEYKIYRRMSTGPKSKRVRFENKTYKTFSNKPVTEIHAFPECGLLIALSDSMLHLYDLNTLEYKMPLSKSKGTSLVAFDIKEKHDTRNAVIQFGATLKICASIGRKLQLWKWKNNEIKEMQSNLSLCRAPRALVWSKNIIFVGFKAEYFMIKVDTEEVQDLFNVGSLQKEPLLSKIDHQTVLVGYDNKSVVFDNSLGLPRKDYYLMWSSVPQFIVYEPPYIVGVLEKHIEVRSFKPANLLQILDIRDVRFLCKGSEFLYVESHNSVSVLVPAKILERVSHHMDRDQFEVALQLVQRSFSLEGSEEERSHLEEKINCRHAVHLFCQHKYKEAMDIFLRLDVDPSHVIGMYSHLLPTKLRNSLTYPEDIPKLEGADFEKALVALIEYLNDKRKLIEREDTLKPLTPLMEGNLTLKTKEQVFSVIDTTLLKCYLNTNEAMIAPLLRTPGHQVHVKEAEKMLLKKQKFSELIILYQQHDMHAEALEMMKTQAGKSQSALYGPDMSIHYLQGLGEEHLPIIFKYSEWVLRDFPAEGLKIFTDDNAMVQALPRGHILSFIENISKDLAIFYLEHLIYEWKDTTEELHFSLAQLLRDKVEKLHQKFMKSQPEGQICPRARNQSGQLGKFRNKLLYFLENSKVYSADSVLMRFSTLTGFYEEKAILFGRLHHHKQALGIYIMILQDPGDAEEHCRKHYNTENAKDKKVFLTLLKIYLLPPDPKVLGLSEYQYKPEPNHTAAISLLQEYSKYIDLIKALEILPPEITVKQLHFFLEASIQSCMAQKYECLVRKKIQFVEYCKISEEKIQYDNTHFEVKEDQNCQVCHRRIGNSVFARYPFGTIIHYGCCKHYKAQMDRPPSLPNLQRQLSDLEEEELECELIKTI